jgi:putative endopeptidase
MLAQIGLDASPIFVISEMPPTDEEIEELGLDAETLGKSGKGMPGVLQLLNDAPLATLQAWPIKKSFPTDPACCPSGSARRVLHFKGHCPMALPNRARIATAPKNTGSMVPCGTSMHGTTRSA